jgi:hypothetical protein
MDASFAKAPTPSHLLPSRSRFLRYNKRYNNREPTYVWQQGPGIQVVDCAQTTAQSQEILLLSSVWQKTHTRIFFYSSVWQKTHIWMSKYPNELDVCNHSNVWPLVKETYV